MLLVYTDAAFAPNSNDASVAFLIKNFQNKKIIAQDAKKITATDNHQAEFLALQFALEFILTNNFQNEIIEFYSDSKALILAVEKNYSKNYPAQIAKISDLLTQFNHYYNKLISDKENNAAHQLANKILHK